MWGTPGHERRRDDTQAKAILWGPWWVKSLQCRGGGPGIPTYSGSDHPLEEHHLPFPEGVLPGYKWRRSYQRPG